MNRNQICLNMIVKNEIENLGRCLSAIAPHITCWAIGDTGSTDGTQGFIEEFFAARNIPGILASFPFKDFAQARNEALALAKDSDLSFDYILFCDADMELVVTDTTFVERLTESAYTVLQKLRDISYWNVRLLRRDIGSRYKGVTHEYVEIDFGRIEALHGIHYIDHATGANRADKYERDARLLKEALASAADNNLKTRYTFYLANTLRDAGNGAEAIKYYRDRADLGGWDQEVYLSLLNIARIKERDGADQETVLSAYDKACEYMSTRAEAFHDAARYCRNHKLFEKGYEYCKKGLSIKRPNNALFNYDWIYDYGLLDEMSVITYWIEAYQESIDLCDRLLSEDKLPESSRPRIKQNRLFAEKKLHERAAGQPAEAHFFKLAEARRKESLSFPVDDVLAIYEAALALKPDCLEAAHGAARLCRNHGIYERGYQIADAAVVFIGNTDVPAVEQWIGDYGLLDELAVNAYWTERYMACVAACDRLLREGRLPASETERVQKNRMFALNRIGNDEAKQQSSRSNEPTLLARQVAAAGLGVETQWAPPAPAAGTELMFAALRERLAGHLDNIDLHLNAYPDGHISSKPLVLWMHHDINQAYVQWCANRDRVAAVTAFVFVSAWQMYRYQATFGIDPAKCHLLRNATVTSSEARIWWPQGITRFAYTSVPFRGLGILLDAWEELALPEAELHVWSSMRLYGQADAPYEAAIARARGLSGVVYHGISPNQELKKALRDIDYLAYPSTFEETSCLAVIDAMEAGCRIIVPSLGALPETTAGFAHLYPWSPDAATHRRNFVRAIRSELSDPWAGRTDLSLVQQRFCSEIYDWNVREDEWIALIREIAA